MSRIRFGVFLCVLAVFCSVPAVFAGQSEPALNSILSNKKKLLVGISEEPPFCMRNSRGEWYGITVDLWMEIARKLQLDYKYKESDLDGLVRDMNAGVCDLDVCPAFITAEGEEKIDFSVPYFVDDTAIAVNADDRSGVLQALHSSCLSPSFLLIVLGIIGIVIVGAAALWVLEHRGESDQYSGKDRKAFARSLYWSITVLTGRDFPKMIGWSAGAPATFAGKLFASVWMMLGVMLFSLFTASLASLITSTQLQGGIKDWKDLQHMRVGTVKEADAAVFLQDLKVKFSTYDTPLQMLEALSRRKIDAAVFGRAGMVYYARAVFNDRIQVLPIHSAQSFMGLPLQGGSPLRKSINVELLKFTQTGQWRDIVNRYQANL